MTNTLTISRELAERCIKHLEWFGKTSEQEVDELRALLAAPAVERQAEPVCIYWDAKTQDCLDTSPPAPIVELLSAVGKFREAFVIAVGDRSPFAKCALTELDACLDKVKEMNR